jgi:uncharacterized protein
MNQQLKDSVLSYIKEKFAGDSSGHDYWHTIRVYNIATTIAEYEKADLETVQLAALLHDVDDVKLFGGKIGQFENAREFMQTNGVSEEIINVVCDIIANMSFKGKDTKVPDSLEGKIVQDADRLDAIGAIGIARVFAYGGSKKRDIWNPEDKPKADMNEEEYSKNLGSSVNHFYEKLLKLKDLMNTEYAKKIAEERHKFMEAYLKEFLNEWEGRK